MNRTSLNSVLLSLAILFAVINTILIIIFFTTSDIAVAPGLEEAETKAVEVMEDV